MLLAAADAVGDATLLWRAAATVGVERDAAEPAAEARLLEIGARAVPPSAGQVSRLPRRVAGAAARRPWRPGLGDRSGARPGPARLASRARGHRSR